MAIRRRLFPWNPWKLFVKKLSVKTLRDAKLQFYEKKLFRTSSFMYFVFIFSECITITSTDKALKVCEYNFFQEV